LDKRSEETDLQKYRFHYEIGKYHQAMIATRRSGQLPWECLKEIDFALLDAEACAIKLAGQIEAIIEQIKNFSIPLKHGPKIVAFLGFVIDLQPVLEMCSTAFLIFVGDDFPGWKMNLVKDFDKSDGSGWIIQPLPAQMAANICMEIVRTHLSEFIDLQLAASAVKKQKRKGISSEDQEFAKVGALSELFKKVDVEDRAEPILISEEVSKLKKNRKNLKGLGTKEACTKLQKLVSEGVLKGKLRVTDRRETVKYIPVGCKRRYTDLFNQDAWPVPENIDPAVDEEENKESQIV